MPISTATPASAALRKPKVQHGKNVYHVELKALCEKAMMDAVDANVAIDEFKALCEKAMMDTVSANAVNAELTALCEKKRPWLIQISKSFNARRQC